MSCCCRINTEQILANFFAKFNSDREVSIAELGNYLDYLSERFPVYVTSDFSSSNVHWCTTRYPGIYTLCEHDDGTFGIKKTEGMIPNLKLFNDCFSEAYASFIERTTEGYFKNATT